MLKFVIYIHSYWFYQPGCVQINMNQWISHWAWRATSCFITFACTITIVAWIDIIAFTFVLVFVCIGMVERWECSDFRKCASVMLSLSWMKDSAGGSLFMIKLTYCNRYSNIPWTAQWPAWILPYRMIANFLALEPYWLCGACCQSIILVIVLLVSS